MITERWTSTALSYSGPAVGANKRLMPAKVDGKWRLIDTPEYRKFLDDLTIVFQAQWRGQDPLKAPMDIQGIIAPGRFDVDAFDKAVQDALEKAGILGNDNLVRTRYFKYSALKVDPGCMAVWLVLLKYEPEEAVHANLEEEVYGKRI